MLHSTDALPLPPHPDIAQYRKLAKELLAAVKSGDSARVESWAKQWITRLFALSDAAREEMRRPQWVDRAAREFADYWSGARTVRKAPPPQPTLAHAQYIIARMQGFANWAELVRFIEVVAQRDSDVQRFEAAVDAIVAGDIGTLRALLQQDPSLIKARSTRGHGATLLHYVSANGVEGYRQKTPPNIVEITKLLLDAGADINAGAHCYGDNDDTLGLTATSAHPANAGVMIPMLELLVARGADVTARSNGWTVVRSCIANGQPEAAAWLVDHGASYDLPGAAAIGRLDLVREFLEPDGTLINGATAPQLEESFRNASWYGQNAVIRYLIDAGFDVTRGFPDGATGLHHAAYDGNVDTVALLLERGVPLDVRDTDYDGNALDWALWAWGADHKKTGDPDAHYKVVAMLRRAGAEIKDAWYTSEGGRRVMERVSGDPRMQAALRGEG